MSLFNRFNKLSKKQNTNKTNHLIEDLNNLTYVLYDIETTGLYHNIDHIIQFAAVKYENNKLINQNSFYIKTNKIITAKIQNLTKIDPIDVFNGLEIKMALKKILKFFDTNIIIAHNGDNFDLKFINTALVNNNFKTINNITLDTLTISRKINSHFKNHKLITLINEYDIEYDYSKTHNAIYDTKMLAAIWLKMVEQLKQIEINNISDLKKILLV